MPKCKIIYQIYTAKKEYCFRHLLHFLRNHQHISITFSENGFYLCGIRSCLRLLVKNMLCNFYTEAIAGMLINLFQNPDKYDRQKTLEYVTIMLNTSLPAVLDAKKKS